MNKKTTVLLNEKGIVVLGIVILTLVFALGFVSATTVVRREKDVTIFTRDELTTIAELQAIEDEKATGAHVTAYKDGDGNLIVSFDYSNDIDQ